MAITVLQVDPVQQRPLRARSALNITAGNTVFLIVTGINTAGSPAASAPTLGGSAVTGAVQLIAGIDREHRTDHRLRRRSGCCRTAPAAPQQWRSRSPDVNVQRLLRARRLRGQPASERPRYSTGPPARSGNSNIPASGTDRRDRLRARVHPRRRRLQPWHHSPGPPGGQAWPIGAGGAPAGYASYQIAASSGGTYNYSGTTAGSAQWTSGVATIATGGSTGAVVGGKSLTVQQAVKRASPMVTRP